MLLARSRPNDRSRPPGLGGALRPAEPSRQTETEVVGARPLRCLFHRPSVSFPYHEFFGFSKDRRDNDEGDFKNIWGPNNCGGQITGLEGVEVVPRRPRSLEPHVLLTVFAWTNGGERLGDRMDISFRRTYL